MRTSFLLTACDPSAELSPLPPFQDEHIDWGKQKLTAGEIQHKVKEYNAQTNSNLYMVVVSDCIRICNSLQTFIFNIESVSYILAKQTLSTLQNKDGSYTGFIKVHFQLVRPISLPPRQSLCSSQEEDQRGRRLKRRTSFYLPKDTAKHLHISSRTRVREVIEALLNKFTVVDNPAKFALFERTERHSQGRILNCVQKEEKKTVECDISKC